MSTTAPIGSTTTDASGGVTTKTGDTPVTILTSGASRANYADNVSSLNAANTSLKQTQMNNPSVVDFLNLNGQASDYNSRAKLALTQGIQNYIGSASQNTQMLNTLRNGTTGSNNNTDVNNGGTGTGDAKTTGAGTNNGTDSSSGQPKLTVTNTVTNNDGSTTATNSDGSSTLTYSDGSVFQLPKGVDPTTAKLQQDNLRTMVKTSENAKTAMDQAQATLNDDPAAAAAAASIKQQYDVLIQQMQDKNNMLLGSYAKNSARTGMLQYANEMDTNFKSMELDKATQRITDLMSKRDNAIMKSNMAYKSGDVKAFDAAQKEYNTSLTDINKGLMDYSKMITDTIKLQDQQAKDAATAAKQQITDDIRVSTALGKEVADAISKSGVTDQTKIDDYISAMADKSGIADSNILKSSVVKAQQDAKKLDLGNTNTSLTIATKQKKLSNPTTPKTPAGKIKFNAVQTTSLIGAGNTGDDIKVMEQAANQYGMQAVIDNPKINEATKTVLESIYGLTRTAK